MRQITEGISTTLGWCIPLDELYYNGFDQNGKNPLDHIYNSESSGWHRLQNMKHPNASNSQELLGDKRRFAAEFCELGIPTVPELLDFDQDQDLSAQLTADDGPVFCKLRRGNQALNAFQASLKDGQIQGETQRGESLKTEEEVNAAWRKLCASGQPLVQPLLENHPKIAQITNSPVLSTLRVITRENKVGAANMTLLTSHDGKHFLLWLDVDPNTGAFSAPKEDSKDRSDFYAQTQQAAMNAPKIVPFWDQICIQSLSAHSNGLDLWAVAWDWGITPDGPILLEGNSGWGLDDWQLQQGSLVPEKISATS
jgi:hypothetical protein